MKKIINGKIYDTEKATHVATWDNDRFPNDFEFCYERLYRKRTGEYFLYGEGGPMSKYAKHYGNETRGSEQITPLSYHDAQKWAEKHLDGEEYEKIFGEIVEDSNDVLIGVHLQASTVERIKREASKAGMTISEYVESKLNG